MTAPALSHLPPLPLESLVMAADLATSPPPPPPPRSGPAGRGIGDVVAGRYKITGIVGKGAMGAVFAAEHAITGQKVALKFMIVGDEDGQEFIARFEQEAKVMAGLRSSNTIRIYDFGHTDDGALFMAMELLVGVPLDKHLRDLGQAGAAMSERDAGQATVQMLRSLGEAHGLGLVHRDMKPGNVFLNDDGSGDTQVKVLDFGLARVGNSNLTNLGRIMGTPAYMSPEQWQGSGVGPAADLYAVGCMMFAMVTGDAPYAAGDNMLSLMHKHCTEDIPDPRERSKVPLSDGFVAIARKAMAKHATERFADAKEMRNAIEALLGGSWTSSLNLGTASSLRLQTSQRAADSRVADDQATIAADHPAALKSSQKKIVPARSESEDATIAAVRQTVGARTEVQGVTPTPPAAKAKMWPVFAGIGVVAIAALAWLATRGGEPAPGPSPAVAAVPVTAPPAAATAGVAAPAPPAALPVEPAKPAPSAAVPIAAPVAVPAVAVPAVAPAPEAAPVAHAPKARVAKPAAPAKKKASTLETVD
jgi:serine/threonine protein kinase